MRVKEKIEEREKYTNTPLSPYVFVFIKYKGTCV